MEKELSSIENSLKNSNFNNGLESLQKLLTKYKSNQTSLQIILDRLYSTGQKLLKSVAPRSTIPLFQILSKLCLILEDYARLCDIKNSLSFCYRSAHQVSSALKEVLEALEIAGDRKELVLKLSALHLNACAIYREDVKDLNIAKTHAELAYFFAKENCNLMSEKDKRTLAVCCFNYGMVLEEMKDISTSLAWFKEGLKFCEEKWSDPQMEKAFRDKVVLLSKGEKKHPLIKQRTASQKPSILKKYHFTRDLMKNRPGTNKKSSKRNSKKFSLTPISNKTLVLNTGNFETRSFYGNDGRGRNTGTPTSSVRSRGVYSEMYKYKGKTRLSLVQCVIKIQKWFRRVFQRRNSYLKQKYLYLAVKVFFGVKYLISVSHPAPDETITIESWPLISAIKKPPNVFYPVKDLKAALNCNEGTSQDVLQLVPQSICIANNQISLSKVVQIFQGPACISGQDLQIHLYCHSRTLRIDATSASSSYSISVPLDPLQDIQNLRSKLDLILKNLELKSGELLFNLI